MGSPVHRWPLQPLGEWGPRLVWPRGKRAELAEITFDKESKGHGNNCPLSLRVTWQDPAGADRGCRPLSAAQDKQAAGSSHAPRAGAGSCKSPAARGLEEGAASATFREPGAPLHVALRKHGPRESSERSSCICSVMSEGRSRDPERSGDFPRGTVLKRTWTQGPLVPKSCSVSLSCVCSANLCGPSALGQALCQGLGWGGQQPVGLQVPRSPQESTLSPDLGVRLHNGHVGPCAGPEERAAGDGKTRPAWGAEPQEPAFRSPILCG